MVNQMRTDVIKLRFAALPDDATVFITNYGMDFTQDEVMEVKKSSLAYNFETPGDYFYYSFGWYGHDCNQYFLSDYGRTWAFSKEDFGKENEQ